MSTTPIRRAALPFLRSFSPRRLFTTIERQPDLDIETFGNLAPWAVSRLSSENSPSTPILIRHHESQPYIVQRALLATVCKHLPDTPVLDLTYHPTQAGLTFLYWLFHRRIPRERDCALPSQEIPEDLDEYGVRARKIEKHYTLGLISSWMVGESVKAPEFQNDVLRTVAARLHQAEVEIAKSSKPYASQAIQWSREAYDSASAIRSGTNLSDFAVDVAAKRVYDVGMHGLSLVPEEQEALSTNSHFASEVFDSLSGQIGTKGVGIQDFAQAYLVEEESPNANAN